MFKVGKLLDVEEEKVTIDFVTQQTHIIGGTTETIETLSFDINGIVNGMKYSFCFDLNCRLEELLKIPQSETIDFKPYLFNSETYFTYDEQSDMDPVFMIKANRWLDNKFVIYINFSTDILMYNDDAYAGSIEFSFNLDDYLDKKK